MSFSGIGDVKRAVVLRRLEDEAFALQKATEIKEQHQRLLEKKNNWRSEAENKKREQKEQDNQERKTVEMFNERSAQQQRHRTATIRNENRKGTNNAMENLKLFNRERKNEEKRQQLENAKHRAEQHAREMQRFREIKNEADRIRNAARGGQEAKRAGALASAKETQRESSAIRQYTDAKKQSLINHVQQGRNSNLTENLRQKFEKQTLCPTESQLRYEKRMQVESERRRQIQANQQSIIDKAQAIKRANDMQKRLHQERQESQRQKEANDRRREQDAYNNALHTSRMERLQANKQTVNQIRTHRELLQASITDPSICGESTRDICTTFSASARYFSSTSSQTSSSHIQSYLKSKDIRFSLTKQQDRENDIIKKKKEVELLKAKRVSLLLNSQEKQEPSEELTKDSFDEDDLLNRQERQEPSEGLTQDSLDKDDLLESQEKQEPSERLTQDSLDKDDPLESDE